ncbi:hypothetical protein GCM10010413_53030 [Promicromonospora sukumoe]|uniref:Uncharacterized protein n=1 Tax=Promicromonospora sukumoe TaxID=88382 RepID=A0A7W3PG80_9MICO|nr:hypothetical protein [Promicromonospora sukumoe]MBA8810506.1 hypothetical protein [Promicromonospora sukumoe]
MTTPTTMPGPWVAALQILAETWQFFARHYPVVFACGALASAQRFLSVSGTADWAGGIGGEAFTAATRLAFGAWAAVVLLRGTEWSDAGARWSAWVTRSWPTILATMAALALFLVVFKLIPDALAGRVGGIDRETWLAWELAIKNVTVIPFTMLWMTVLLGVRPLGQVG